MSPLGHGGMKSSYVKNGGIPILFRSYLIAEHCVARYPLTLKMAYVNVKPTEEGRSSNGRTSLVISVLQRI